MDNCIVDGRVNLCRLSTTGPAAHWAMAPKIALSLSLILAGQCALAQAMYRIKPIGSLPGGCIPLATGFNSADQITGQACNANGDFHAFLWSNDGTPMEDLGPPEAGSFSQGFALNASGLVGGTASDSTGTFAFESSGDGTPMRRVYDTIGGQVAGAVAINDLGQLTGFAKYAAGDSAYHAFLWKNNGSPMLDLGSVRGVSENQGKAINASGQVAGYLFLSSNATHAFVWKNDGGPMQDLGTLGGRNSNANFINASGQVSGSSNARHRSRTHAFLWRNDGTPMQDLGTLGGGVSFPAALNDAGQVAGVAETRASVIHAFVWLNDGTPMQDLGTLGGTQSYAFSMNSSGQVMGSANLPGDNVSHAFIWRNDGTKIQDLNTLIDPTDPLKHYVTLNGGEFSDGLINDSGDIVADGTDSRTGMTGLYLLQGTALTLNPRTLAFGNQPIDTTSATKSVTMTNTSPKAAAIISIALTGTASGQFASTDDCGKSLAGHATCTIKVTFKPTSKGAKSETLNVNGGGGGLRSVNLTGTGK